MTDEPTCDLDAERAILGAVITEPHYAKQLLDIPREHFYAPAHQDLHTAITTMVLNGDPLDPTTILASTRNHTTPNTRNLHQLVTQLVGTGYGESIPYHARRLHQLHTARTLITTAQTLLHRTTEAIHNNNPEDLATAARTATTALNNTNPETNHTTTYENTLEDWWTDTLQPLDLTNVIPTPWPELNDMLNGGLHPGRSYILAGRPGAGKSVAALNIAGHATENNKHTSLWSLEMPTLEVMSRILANGARAEYSQITKHQLDQHNQNLLAAYTDATQPYPSPSTTAPTSPSTKSPPKPTPAKTPATSTSPSSTTCNSSPPPTPTPPDKNKSPTSAATSKSSPKNSKSPLSPPANSTAAQQHLTAHPHSPTYEKAAQSNKTPTPSSSSTTKPTPQDNQPATSPSSSPKTEQAKPANSNSHGALPTTHRIKTSSSSRAPGRSVACA
ncbi:hypothetical protein N806_20380 [Rhodococcus sp. P27]|nr:hypothetical protein N806_12105 [Rhodococcus sp. P27]ERB53502.1 hypothetical protein N806_20380 [Rhodococcus sp. P27]